MEELTAPPVRQVVDGVYRSESRRVLATLIRLVGDFDRAEEALHEAFAAALEQWPRDGVPANPRAWLVSAGRFKAVDAMRRQTRRDASLAEIAGRLGEATISPAEKDEELEDDRLRLIFTCCHPALSREAQVALTLREVCGLATEEIAGAFLTAATTIAQRIVRGKAKIRDARIPYQAPSVADLPERLDSVLTVIYLIFNEGYSASSGDSLTRPDLSEEAIRLGRLLVGTSARSGGGRPAGPDAVPGVAAGGPDLGRRRPDPVGRSGPFPLGPREDRRGRGACRTRHRVRAVRRLHDSGGHRRGPCRGADGRMPRIGAG